MMKEYIATMRSRWPGKNDVPTGGTNAEEETPTLKQMHRELARLSEQLEAFHLSVGRMKAVSADLESLHKDARTRSLKGRRLGKDFEITASRIGNLAQHSKTNIEEAVTQLTLFVEITRGLGRDFNNTVRRIEENLDAFHALEVLLNAHFSSHKKGDREETNRM